jgi:hypothetical protein
MKFDVIFLNSLLEEYTLTYRVYDNDISVRWFESLKDQVLNISNKSAEPDRLYNFPDDVWSEEKLVNELNSCIEIINKRNKVITHTAYVGMPQEQLNHLHHYFENLRGGTLTPAEYWEVADEEEQIALERYNIIIHRAENFYHNQNAGSYYPRLVFRFKDRKRYELSEDDYQHFTLHRKFGEVYINYCEVGKPLYDVYKDGDDVVGEDNIRPLKWYSPDFTAYFHDRGSNSVNRFLKGMDEWWDRNDNYLTVLGFTKGDPRNAIGNIPVAMLETDLSNEDVIYSLVEFNKMDRVEIHE